MIKNILLIFGTVEHIIINPIKVLKKYAITFKKGLL